MHQLTWQAANWKNGITPLELEDKSWLCWGTRSTPEDARARLTRWVKSDMADIQVLRLTLSAKGLAMLVGLHALEVKPLPDPGLRLYEPLWRICKCMQTDEVLYTVESHHEVAGDVMTDIS